MSVHKLFLDDAYLKTNSATITHIAENGVYLDQTLFYATSGGQSCDLGTINGLALQDVTKADEDEILHVLAPTDLATLAVGQSVNCILDWERRYNHMRFHTALHLMCALIKGSVSGCAINADKSRVDFNVDAGLYTPEQLTQDLNALIAANQNVTYDSITDSDLDANPSLVRSLSVQPPRGNGRIRLVRIGTADAPVDQQPCGGTHVATTSEIGKITITKIENKGKQNRRFHLSFVS